MSIQHPQKSLDKKIHILPVFLSYAFHSPRGSLVKLASSSKFQCDTQFTLSFSCGGLLLSQYSIFIELENLFAFFVDTTIFYEFNCIFDDLLKTKLIIHKQSRKINIFGGGVTYVHIASQKVWTRKSICCRCFFHMASTRHVDHL